MSLQTTGFRFTNFYEVENPPNPTPITKTAERAKDIQNDWENFLAPTSTEINQNTRPQELGLRTVIGQKETLAFNTVQTTRIKSSTQTSKKDTDFKEVIKFRKVAKEAFSFSLQTAKTLLIPNKDVKIALWDLFAVKILGFGQKAAKPENPTAGGKRPPLRLPFQNPLTSLRSNLEQARILKNRAEEVNKKVGAKNLSFEGFTNSSGQIREDIQAILDKANSELEKQQIKAKRESQLANLNKGKGKSKKGPGVSMDLNKAAESQNNVTKLLG